MRYAKNMLNKFFGKFSKDLGIDLGTKNTLVYSSDNGIIINEPSVVAVNMRTDEILAVGEEAKKMIGKTPAHIQAVRPLVGGVISDFEVTEKMIKYFIDKARSEYFSLMPKPKVIIGIPLDTTEVEKKAVEDAAKSAGARKVYLIEEPMAAVIGARMPITEATATMIVDIGGGTTDIAVVSLSGIVTWKSLRLAGDEFDNNIIKYIREEFNILIGEQTAEKIKINIGAAVAGKEPMEMEIKGRNLFNGLPKALMINDGQIREAISHTINKIVENIKITLEKTPPELVADLYEHGIILTGGGSLLRGLDKEISTATKIPARIVEDPLTCVVRGIGVLLSDPKLLDKIILPNN